MLKNLIYYEFVCFFTESNKPESTGYPNLADIISAIPSLSELQIWARDNGLTGHPIVQQRIDYILSHLMQTFTDAETLIEWAIQNNVLTNQQVLNRISDLQTCQKCGIKFELTSALRQHQILHKTKQNDDSRIIRIPVVKILTSQ